MKKIILASASPRRKELLEQIGIIADIQPSTIQEVITKTEPAQLVEDLSEQKCLSVALSIQDEDAIVIGSDTVVVLDGKILGKPKSEKDAYQMLNNLMGRTHEVFTGVTLQEVNHAGLGRKEVFHACTQVTIAPMTKEEIEAYIATGDPLDKAGSYGIQGIFSKHIEKIHGDYNNVVGLPLSLVYEKLKVFS